MSGEIRKRVIAQRNERRLTSLQQRRMGPTCVFTVVSGFFKNSPLISSLCRPPERSLMFTRPVRTHQVLSRALTCSRARVRACACVHRAACQEFISFFFSSLGHCCGQIFFAVWTLSLDHKTTCWPPREKLFSLPGLVGIGQGVAVVARLLAAAPLGFHSSRAVVSGHRGTSWTDQGQSSGPGAADEEALPRGHRCRHCACCMPGSASGCAVPSSRVFSLKGSFK